MEDLMQRIVSLAKRRGFIFQSSEIYGGLKSAYDYGPLGVELKRNIMNAWWQEMVQSREDVVGLDASILMHPQVWQASGHLAGFSDPLVDCLNCKERFRADKAPKAEPGVLVDFYQGGKKSSKTLLHAEVEARGYVCPACGSPQLSEERPFNLMFRTSIGAVDPVAELAKKIASQPHWQSEDLQAYLQQSMQQASVYLRPETAQAMFVQFLNVQQSMSMKVPFGIAQMGKSFRNEITVEHFIFRSCEFEQMEMEFFVQPGTQQQWLHYWRDARMTWWKKFANHPEAFRARAHDHQELAHYADACYDIEYLYPWGWGELEGVASRTDYDLKTHEKHAGVKLSYFDPQEVDPNTGKVGYRYLPYVIEPAAGATRAVLVYLLDAYCEEEIADSTEKRLVLKLHPQLAPIKAAVLPLVKKDGMPELAREIVELLLKAGIVSKYDEQHAIGKRYRRHDEIGTPFCITVDGQSKIDRSVTLRYRDTMAQERLNIDAVLPLLQQHLATHL